MSELARSKMIIDAGSSDNIASTGMVDQLGQLPFYAFKSGGSDSRRALSNQIKKGMSCGLFL